MISYTFVQVVWGQLRPCRSLPMVAMRLPSHPSATVSASAAHANTHFRDPKGILNSSRGQWGAVARGRILPVLRMTRDYYNGRATVPAARTHPKRSHEPSWHHGKASWHCARRVWG